MRVSFPLQCNQFVSKIIFRWQITDNKQLWTITTSRGSDIIIWNYNSDNYTSFLKNTVWHNFLHNERLGQIDASTQQKNIPNSHFNVGFYFAEDNSTCALIRPTQRGKTSKIPNIVETRCSALSSTMTVS